MSTTNTNTTEALASTQEKTNATKPAKPDFGKSRYSRIMSIAYEDAIRVIGLEPEHAERYARSFGADLGRTNVCPESMKDLKFSKVNADGFTKIRETGKSTLVKFSYAMELNRFIVGLDELRSSVANNTPLYTVELADHLQEWLESK